MLAISGAVRVRGHRAAAVIGMNASRAIVTGPMSGIGKEIASQLASRGAEVILACRDAEGGKQTAEEIAEGATAVQPACHPC